jgi:hypothetical protein
MALSNNFKGQKNPRVKDGMIVSNRKATAQSIRSSARQNVDKTVSTHKMEWGGTGNKKYKYSVNPTIFPEKNGTWKDLEGQGPEALKEATKRGEVFGFKSAKRAEKFSAGSWKKGQDRKEAMKNYRSAKKAGELYTQSEEFKAQKKSNRKK